MAVIQEPFGATREGQAVDRFILRSGAAEAEIITFGAALRTLLVPDRSGKQVDVVLGYDTLAEYETNGGFFGSLVGRYANRIAGGRFALNGREYTLARNDGPNHLHGGPEGFDKKVWQGRAQTRSSVSLSLFSPDGEEGYPGNLEVTVTYTLRGQGLEIAYRARSSRTTLCNLTNHAYFNLSGHDSGPVTGQHIRIFSNHYTPAGPGLIGNQAGAAQGVGRVAHRGQGEEHQGRGLEGVADCHSHGRAAHGGGEVAHIHQEGDSRLLPQGLDDGADEQGAEQALGHGAQRVDAVAPGGEHDVLTLEERVDSFHFFEPLVFFSYVS